MTRISANITGRLLLGPGPSNVAPAVTAAMQQPMIGHLDPQFLQLMDELQSMLRRAFLTDNPFTIAVSGTGTAGMESTLVNLTEPGDEVLVCVNGLFGNRICDIVQRIGGVLHRIDRPWGEVFDTEEIVAALNAHPRTKIVAIVHAETSTGALQPLPEIGALCRDRDLLLLVDAVTSLSGCELRVDDWMINACYSATQKCLNCPPGLAPVTLGPRALDKLRQRNSPPLSWYFDFQLIRNYWSEGSRAYHHTAPISMNYALHQALAQIVDEGLASRWQRHQKHSTALLAGLEALGCRPVAAGGGRLPTLSAVYVPEGVDEGAVRSALLTDHNIEIGGGLGELAGKIWRVGLMGTNARREVVIRFLGALEDVLGQHRAEATEGRGLAAAASAYEGSG